MSAAEGYTCSASATSTSCSRARFRPTPPLPTSRHCVPTRATARSASLRTPGVRSTTACSSARINATATASKSAWRTRSASPRTTAADCATSLWNSYDDTNFWGPSSFDRTHVLSVYYIYDLPFWRDPTSLMKNLLGGWQISGVQLLPYGHAVLNHADERHCRRW